MVGQRNGAQEQLVRKNRWMKKFDTFMSQQEMDCEIGNHEYQEQEANFIAMAADQESNQDSLYDTNGMKKRNLINLQNFGDYDSSANNS